MRIIVWISWERKEANKLVYVEEKDDQKAGSRRNETRR